MRFAYADPPYIGQAKRHYGNDPRCAEVNHAVLLGTLEAECPDGWALSCSTPSLRAILPLCPDGVRVLAWIKPFCAFKANVTLAYAWEPIILRGGRLRGRDLATVRDWYAEPITLKRGLVGAKPVAVCFWLFDCLGVEPGDELWDVFPGSGIVTRAFEAYTRQAQEHKDLPLFGETANG